MRSGRAAGFEAMHRGMLMSVWLSGPHPATPEPALLESCLVEGLALRPTCTQQLETLAVLALLPMEVMDGVFYLASEQGFVELSGIRLRLHLGAGGQSSATVTIDIGPLGASGASERIWVERGLGSTYRIHIGPHSL